MIRHRAYAYCLAVFLCAGGAGARAAESSEEVELDPSLLDDSTLVWRAPVKPQADAQPSGGININSADAEMLSEALHGVGPAKARAIVEYRNSHGPFKSPAQIMEVKGIGEAIWRANQKRISVE